jgi:hypothetical protein
LDIRVHSPRIATLLSDLDHQEFDVRLAALDQRQAPVAAEKQRCAVRFCTWLPACLFDPIRGFSSDTHLNAVDYLLRVPLSSMKWPCKVWRGGRYSFHNRQAKGKEAVLWLDRWAARDAESG